MRIAVWGTFDVDNYGDQLFPRIAAHELRRRDAEVVVDAFAPFGWTHPTRLDGDQFVSPLGRRDDEHLDALATTYDCVLVGGGELMHLNDRLLAPVYGVSGDEMDVIAPSRWFVEGLGVRREADCPVVWHAVGVPAPLEGDAALRVRTSLATRSYVTVRDAESRRRLHAAGVRAPITVVPDSALLVDRLFASDALDRAIGMLRSRGSYPVGRALAVQGCDLMLPHVEAVAAQLRALLDGDPELTPVLIETGRCRGDAAFADRLERALGMRVYRMPEMCDVLQIAAAIRGAHAAVGSSLHLAITAYAFGTPFVILNLPNEAKLDAFGATTNLTSLILHRIDDLPEAYASAVRMPSHAAYLAGLQAEIDGHFDRVMSTAAQPRSRTTSRPSSPSVRPARSNAARICSPRPGHSVWRSKTTKRT